LNRVEKKLESNIWKLYLYMVLYSMVFYIPIIVLFYLDNGLSMVQIMTIQSLSSLLFIILEIPSGYITDIFGRQKSLLITGITAAIAMLLFASGTKFSHFLWANLFWAVAGSFISGADSAFLYDTLIDLKKEDLYKKIWGNTVFYYAMGASLASVLGGWIGSINYRYTFYAAIPLMLLLIPLSLSFEEPQRHKMIFSNNYLFNLIGVLKKTIIKNAKLRWLFIYSSVIVGFSRISYFLYQPYFKLSGLDVAWFGIVFAGFNIISALSSKYSHLLEKKIGRKYSLILLIFLIGASYLLMSHFIFLLSFSFAFLIQFVKGFSSVVISDYVNKLTDSSVRATILSVKSLIERMFYALIIPFIGWIIDIYSLKQALALSGLFILVCGSIILLLLGKNHVFDE
jgi:MFS family permease